jgi:hypothetical protein
LRNSRKQQRRGEETSDFGALERWLIGKGQVESGDLIQEGGGGRRATRGRLPGAGALLNFTPACVYVQARPASPPRRFPTSVDHTGADCRNRDLCGGGADRSRLREAADGLDEAHLVPADALARGVREAA